MAAKSQALLAIILCFGAAGALKAAEIVTGFNETDQAASAGASGQPMLMAAAAAPAEPKPETSRTAPVIGAISEAEAARYQYETGEVKTPDEIAAAGDDENALLRALRKRERELRAYEQKLDERKMALDAAARKIEARLAELEQRKAELSGLVDEVDGAAQRDVAHLVDMYSKMKPKQAGEIFNAMDPRFAAGFLSQMKSQSASLILANMETPKAYAVSLELAGRNVQRPE
ncbi:MAG: hypothetical protein AAFV62_00170 [Pseudomonadota bacterium]